MTDMVAFPAGRAPATPLTDFIFSGETAQVSPSLDATNVDDAEDYVFPLTRGCPCCRLTGDSGAARFSAQSVPSDLEATSDQRP